MNFAVCHVERICQSGSDRDISYCFLRKPRRTGGSERFFDSAVLRSE